MATFGPEKRNQNTGKLRPRTLSVATWSRAVALNLRFPLSVACRRLAVGSVAVLPGLAQSAFGRASEGVRQRDCNLLITQKLPNRF